MGAGCQTAHFLVCEPVEIYAISCYPKFCKATE